MATLTGTITDVTGRAPDSISSITVKAPSARIGSGTGVIVSSPAEVTFDRATGDVTISGLTGGLSWLYIEGDGWSDSIALSVADGMIALVEAVANAAGAPGLTDYIRLLAELETRIDDIGQGAVDAALETKADKVHQHSSAEITDTTHAVGSEALAGRLVKLNPQGKLFVSTASITDAGDVVNKQWVEQHREWWRGDRAILKKSDGTFPQVEELDPGAHSVGDAGTAIGMNLPVPVDGTLDVHKWLNGEFARYTFRPTRAPYQGHVWEKFVSYNSATGWRRTDGHLVEAGEYWAPAATKALTVPTHEGSGQATHPAALYFPDGWNGYKYWMAHTSYPDQDNAHEDPCVVASNDGETWVVPSEAAFPLDDAPGSAEGGSYNSDTELVMRGASTMYCMWREFKPDGTTTLWWRYTTSGTGWAPKMAVYDGPLGVSPSLMFSAGTWRMYYNKSGQLYYRETNVIHPTTADWGAEVACTMENVPEGMWQWHSQVRKVGTKYYNLTMCAPQGSSANGILYLADSDDGINFRMGSYPVVPAVNHWHTGHYRSSLIAHGEINPTFEIFYTGTGPARKSHIARTWATHGNDAARVMDYVSRNSPQAPSFSGGLRPTFEAPEHSTYLDQLSTNGASRWVKTADEGTAGWKVVEGDTGWRSIPHNGESGELIIRRINDEVEMHFRDFVVGGSGVKILLSFPYGFVPSVPQYGLLVDRYFRALPQVVGSRNGLSGNISWIAGVDGSTTPTAEPVHGTFRWVTDQGWPSTLPGAPA